MRILFAGSPDIAVPSLLSLVGMHEVCAVLTNPDHRSGRGKRLSPTPVKQVAVERSIPVLQPQRLGSDARSAVRSLEPELLVVVAYGRIFGPRFLGLFPHGGVNLHPSLLPRYRGPAPIPAAIMNGDSHTGVCIQKVALGIDSGDVFAREEIPLSGSETAGVLASVAAERGARLLCGVVQAIEQGTATAVLQDHEAATYCSLIEKSDGLIDWSRPAVVIERAVRAYNPWPLAHTIYHGRHLSILRADVLGVCGTDTSQGDPPPELSGADPGTVVSVDKRRGILIQTGDGLLAAQELQLQSRKAMSWKDFLNGAPGFVGSILGER